MKLHHIKNKFLFLVLFLATICLEINANNTTLNINNIINNATNSNKQVMVFFHMSHCGYCKRMKNRTLNNPQIKNYMDKNFVLIDINIDDHEKVLFNNISYSKQDFADQLEVDFFPTVIFFDEEAEITYMARGYRKIQKFQKILKFIHTKSFEKVDFFDYNQ